MGYRMQRLGTPAEYPQSLKRPFAISSEGWPHDGGMRHTATVLRRTASQPMVRRRELHDRSFDVRMPEAVSRDLETNARRQAGRATAPVDRSSSCGADINHSEIAG